MSAPYTLHVAPYGTPGDPHALDRADLVRDGFSWGAFLVPMLWFFRHRHWLLGLGALAAVAGLALVLWLLGFGIVTILCAELLLHLLIGLEGPSLRGWAYGRSGRPAVDVVTASDEAEAESKSFGRWLADPAGAESPKPPRSPPPIPGRWGGEPIIGLFPESGAPR